MQNRPQILVLFASAFILGCHQKPLSDSLLADRFSVNENWFDDVSSRYASGQIICDDKRDTDICIVTVPRDVLSHLQQSAGVQSVYVKRNHPDDDGVWFPIQTYGFMSMSSSTRGYVYLKNPPSALISDTLDDDTKGNHYKSLKDHWYLFTAN
jgi:hypothetical protein